MQQISSSTEISLTDFVADKSKSSKNKHKATREAAEQERTNILRDDDYEANVKEDNDDYDSTIIHDLVQNMDHLRARALDT